MKVKPKRQFMTWGLNQVTNQKQKASQKKRKRFWKQTQNLFLFFDQFF